MWKVVPSPLKSFREYSASGIPAITDNRLITCHQIAKGTQSVIHKHLKFSSISVFWLPRQLSAFNRHRTLKICNELNERFNTVYYARLLIRNENAFRGSVNFYKLLVVE